MSSGAFKATSWEAPAHEHRALAHQSVRRPPVVAVSTPGDLLLQRQTTCACGGECPRCQNHQTAQNKLQVSTPGDHFEQEADRIAEQVITMPESHADADVKPTAHSSATHLQRKCAACSSTPQAHSIEDEEEHKLVQFKKQAGHEGQVIPEAFSQVESLRNGGEPLAESVRSYFEPRFGYDFGQVRVHTYARAAESAREVNALAYTMGRDVVFRAGQYAPETPTGRWLLAHELAHVVQQTGGAEPSGTAAEGGPSERAIRRPEEAERGTNRAAKQPSRSSAAGLLSPVRGGPVVQRRVPPPGSTEQVKNAPQTTETQPPAAASFITPPSDRAARSVHVIIKNDTGLTMKLVGPSVEYGIITHKPPDSIPSSGIGEFFAQSNRPAVGTEGTVIYQLGDSNGKVSFYWNNPFVGKNSVKGSAPAGFKVAQTGNKSNDTLVFFTIHPAEREVTGCNPEWVIGHLGERAEESLRGFDRAFGFFSTPFKRVGFSGWVETGCEASGEGWAVRDAQYSTDDFWTIDVKLHRLTINGRNISTNQQRFVRIEVEPGTLIKVEHVLPAPGETLVKANGLIRFSGPVLIDTHHGEELVEVHPRTIEVDGSVRP